MGRKTDWLLNHRASGSEFQGCFTIKALCLVKIHGRVILLKPPSKSLLSYLVGDVHGLEVMAQESQHFLSLLLAQPPVSSCK